MARFSILTMTLLAVMLTYSPVEEINKEQKRDIAKLANAVKKAGSLYTAKKYDESGEQIAIATELIENLVASGNEEIIEKIAKDYSRVKRAGDMLTIKNVEVPVLQSIEELKKLGAEKAPPQKEVDDEAADDDTADDDGAEEKKSEAGEDESEATDSDEDREMVESKSDEVDGDESKGANKESENNQISFVEQIVPILSKSCGTCHIRQSKGKFSAASFASLVSNKEIIDPGNADESVLVHLVEDGEMPPKRKLKKEDAKLLRDWVAQGAKFDGKDENEKIGQSGRGSRRNR